MQPEALGVLLISGSHERAHYAFVLAAGAAALGRQVTVFATNEGCHALLTDWSGLADAGRDAVIRERGVAGLDELRSAAVELGVRLLVCEAGLRGAALPEAGLWPGVEIAGVASFLEAARGGQIISF
ncbi:MAG: DsrE/DsrF/DrsH-like family protein [Rhodospirillales bacterium]